jgi:hypothetical protein
MPEIIKITNPEALALIEKFKSGEFKARIMAFFHTHRLKFGIVGGGFLALIAIMIGLSLATPQTVYYNPDFEAPITATPVSESSQTEVIRRRLIDTNLSLPDPAIPVYELRIDMQEEYYD